MFTVPSPVEWTVHEFTHSSSMTFVHPAQPPTTLHSPQGKPHHPYTCWSCAEDEALDAELAAGMALVNYANDLDIDEYLENYEIQEALRMCISFRWNVLPKCDVRACSQSNNSALLGAWTGARLRSTRECLRSGRPHTVGLLPSFFNSERLNSNFPVCSDCPPEVAVERLQGWLARSSKGPNHLVPPTPWTALLGMKRPRVDACRGCQQIR